MNIDLKEIANFVPRKMVASLIAMWLIGDFAQQGVDWKILMIMAVPVTVAIALHYMFENKTNGQSPAQPK